MSVDTIIVDYRTVVIVIMHYIILPVGHGIFGRATPLTHPLANHIRNNGAGTENCRCQTVREHGKYKETIKSRVQLCMAWTIAIHTCKMNNCIMCFRKDPPACMLQQSHSEHSYKTHFVGHESWLSITGRQIDSALIGCFRVFFSIIVQLQNTSVAD